MVCFFLMMLVCFFWARRMQHFNNHIPEIESGISSNRRQTSKEITSSSVELRATEVCFLHIQLVGRNVRLPNMNTIPPEVDFEIFKVSSKVSLGPIPIDNAAPYYPHGNIVCGHLCDECRNQTSQAFVTGSCPIRDHSCQFVYEPKNVKTTNSCQIQAFQDILRAYFGKILQPFPSPS